MTSFDEGEDLPESPGRDRTLINPENLIDIPEPDG